MKNLILVGYMGSGKTSLGIKLSYQMKIPFIDTDAQIEKGQHKTISDIFKDEGEAFFRTLETNCLEELQQDTGNYIISVGGGLPMKEENRMLLKKLGTTIYLKATVQTILERLESDQSRPLLQGDNREQRIKEMLDQRASYYEAVADIVVEVDHKSFEEIIEEIEQGVRGGDNVKDISN